MRANQITTANIVGFTTITNGLVNGVAMSASRLMSKCHSLHTWLKRETRELALAFESQAAAWRARIGLGPVAIVVPVVSVRPRPVGPDYGRYVDSRRTGYQQSSRI